MRVSDGIATLTAEEYVEMLNSALEGDGHVHKYQYNEEDGGVTTVTWGFECDDDASEVLRDVRASNAVQRRLMQLLREDTPHGLADRLYEQLGDEAHTHEYMALEADDETVRARRQGIATGIRLAQTMVNEEG